MALSSSYKFIAAKPVWEKDKETEMNFSLVSKAVIDEGTPAVIHISAHSRYQIFVNGAFFSAGPARAAHGFFRVDEYDISSLMTQKENIVIIITAGYNVNSFYLTDQPSFICAEIVSGDDVLFATGTEKEFHTIRYLPRVQRVMRYSFQRPFTEYYECHATYDFFMTIAGENYPNVPLVGCGEKTFIERGVEYGDFEELKPASIVAKGIMIPNKNPKKFTDRSLENISDKLKGYPKNRLYTNAVHEVYEYATQILEDEKTEPECVSLGINCCALYDMGYNSTGYIRLSLTAQHDTVVYAVFGQKLDEKGVPDAGEDNCANVVVWSLQGGRAYDLVSFEPYTYRYIQVISMYAPVLVSNVSQYREAMSGKALTNLHKMPDEKLAKIYKAAVETFVQNSTDIFMDCPSRERAGWLCDSRFTSIVEAELTGRNTVEKNFLENYIIADGFEDLPDGMLPMCYPADHYDGAYIPNWAMWYVIELFEHTKRCGDDLYTFAKEKVYALADFFTDYENEDALLEKLSSWVFIEWSEANNFTQDVNYPTNMLYAKFLDCIGMLYEDNSMIEKAEKVRKAVIKQSFDGKFFRDNAVREKGDLVVCDNRTETCQYYAFFTGTATKESHPELWATLMNDFGPVRTTKDIYPDIYKSNAFIGNYLRLELLLNAGEKDKLSGEIVDFFLPMAEKTGTLWENMSPNASCNHGFASFVAYILNRLY